MKQPKHMEDYSKPPVVIVYAIVGGVIGWMIIIGVVCKSVMP